ncbi:hypothetical protein CNR22_04300 [Sphingobacteriaceae bacterium]|nr:hypothetical protein CNR22_04300 [Sphingobacteriaceae bacterium]
MASQAPSFDEMEFEPDSVKTIYKPAGKNYVIVKSKRGNSGLNKTPQADAILTAEVTEIVLVFSETESSDLAEREEANRERWENLLMTYPELFQFSTTYKNVCQCKVGGDAEAFKQSQGFYVYVNGEVPKVAEAAKPVEAPPAAKTNVAVTPAPAAPAKTAKVEEAKPVAEKEVAPPDRTAVKTKEVPPPVEKTAPVATPPPAKTVEEPVATKAPVEEAPVEEEVVKPAPKKKVASTKPRRAKDPKACRPACYGFGDEDLHEFFKTNFPLTKKERKKAKNWIANVRLQINFDGTIKKVIVTGQEEAFNLKVQEVLKGMNPWNAAVKSGVAVKSEVRFNLKFDKETKTMKPMDMIMNPKPTPKCQCVSDSEIFAD